ncbi:hypothetical protein WJX81_007796 [Elliptochloris bilobata]|uniref:Aminopeptidase N n=1 Tax=Elliptochloris bilobata TaxID=381761 RepID=A0AAW1SJN1_9CHLO
MNTCSLGWQAARYFGHNLHRCRLSSLTDNHIPSLARTAAGALFAQPQLAPNAHRSFNYTPDRRCQQRVSAVVAAPPEADTMVKAEPQAVYRKDYKPPPYLIERVHLTFVLNEDSTRVLSRLSFKPNYDGEAPPPLPLDGRKDVKLVAVKVAGEALAADSYELTDKKLTLSGLPKGAFEVEIETEIKPQENTSLEGLYKSSGNFVTQCEAEGFRGITFFLDRPDVMAKYTTRVEAAKEPYPVLLSNGNLLDSGDLPDGRHFAVWEDPFPKPCYLFALVAGSLSLKEDTFTTRSGRSITLRIYAEAKDIDKVGHAMRSLQKAMKWDEDVFGLEYDLDLFNIVAVSDFNMGAMENKSLNIFNSRLVIASPATSSDLDFARVEGVVAHEYFHNWTGNRVTCRDWFQLTLKEGLTVFRDQEFSADMNSRAVKRIDDVTRLRTAQFAEDSGAMSHPIRPDKYIKMDNFYTLTVYEKGAEIVRMYNTLLGKEGFRKGMDLYFQRHDGQAVTCDDFRAAMADAKGRDLSAFAAWYGQAGTPQVTVAGEYDAAARTFTLSASQRTPPTPGQSDKAPVPIPIAVGLLGADGQELPLHLKGHENGAAPTTEVLLLEGAQQEFVFTEVSERPVPSLLRGFSAPVKLEVEGQDEEQLRFLLAHDSDPFCRWEAGQRLLRSLLMALYAAAADTAKGESVEERVAGAGGVPEALVGALRAVLDDPSLDGAFVAAAISLPSASELIDDIPGVDPVVLHDVRQYVARQLAEQLRPELEAAVKRTDSAPGEAYSPDAASAARRALKNRALYYLGELGDAEVGADLLRRTREATNMTDHIAALAALIDHPGAERDTALQEFYEAWKGEPLVLLKWIGIQAGAHVPGNLGAVKGLLGHPAFALSNPNMCYALFLSFLRSTPNFHAADGSGYAFLADSILQVDKVNRQVAARMTGSSAFTSVRKFDARRQGLMRAQLQRILAQDGLSENVYEIASSSLQE